MEWTESRRRSAWSRAACLVACLCALACKQSQPTGVRDADTGGETEVVVAWVDGEPVLLEEVLAAPRRGGDRSREARIEAALLDRVATLEARRQGLHKRPEIERALRDTRVDARRREQEILRRALRQEIVDDVEISEEELRQAYEEDERSYLAPQLRLREWSFESEQEARSALEAPAGGDVLDPGQATEVPPFSLRKPPPRYARVMGRLRRPGERAVIEGEGDWLVVELAALDSDAKMPFEEVRDSLARRLRRQRAESRFEQQLQELRASSDVRIDEAVLSDEELWRGFR